MSGAKPSSAVTDRRAEMRRKFDHGFAVPAVDFTESVTDLLAVRLGADGYALRLTEIVGLYVDLTVVPLPNPASNLLGIAVIRGMMTPIYDLAALLGYPPATTARWTAMTGAPHVVGFALEEFESHVRVRDSLLNVNRADSANPADAYSRGAVQAAGALRPILQITALIQLIRENAHDG